MSGYNSLENTRGTGGSGSGSDPRIIEFDTENLLIGTNSINYPFVGDANLGIGNNSLLSNTTGVGNVGLGVASLKENTTGSANTTVGVNSQYSNQTGDNNSSLGYGSLYGLSLDDNTAIGYNAPVSTVTGSSQSTYIGSGATSSANNPVNRIALGYGASCTADNSCQIGDANVKTLKLGSTPAMKIPEVDTLFVGTDPVNLTSGYGSTSLGINSLDSITSGFRCTSVGKNALTANTTGYNNTSIGAYALEANVIGNQCTAIGSGALANSTGSNSTVVGYAAGNSNTSAGSQTFIGAYSGYYSTGQRNTAVGSSNFQIGTTGTNNVLLGYAADVSDAAAINRIAIGSSSSCTLDNSCQIGDSSVNTLNLGSRVVANFPNTSSTILGHSNSLVTGLNNVLVGDGVGMVLTTGVSNLSAGNGNNLTNSSYSVALGSNSVCYASYAIAMGNSAYARSQSMSYGYTAGQNVTGGANNIYFGHGCSSTSASVVNNIVCIGASARTTNAISTATAIGSGAIVVASNSTAIGAGAITTTADEIVLGNATVNKIRGMNTSTLDLGDATYPFQSLYLNNSLIFTDASNSIGNTNYGVAKFYSNQTSDGITGSFTLSTSGTTVVPNTTITLSAKNGRSKETRTRRRTGRRRRKKKTIKRKWWNIFKIQGCSFYPRRRDERRS